MTCPAPVPILATAKQPGYWQCDVGNGRSNWVDFQWPFSAILEQAFCLGWPSVDFRRGGNDYRVILGQWHRRLQEACNGQPCDAEQVNQQTNAKRPVRRWPSACAKGNWEAAQLQKAQQNWVNWTNADWAWLLDVDGPDPPSVPTPPRRRYALESCFKDAFWPPLLQSWPNEKLISAAHPKGERCNFALKRLLPTRTDGDVAAGQEWSAVKNFWQQSGKGTELLAAFRVQNRGLIEAFCAQQKVMQARLSDDFTDGQRRDLGVQLLWHGTRSVQGLLDICRDGFDRARAQTCVYGKGCYFATSASYSDRYACDVHLPRSADHLLHPQVRAVFLAAVLVGECVVGSNNMYPPPQKPHSVSGERYENTCDRLPKPTIFVTYKDQQALPLYIMLYKP